MSYDPSSSKIDKKYIWKLHHLALLTNTSAYKIEQEYKASPGSSIENVHEEDMRYPAWAFTFTPSHMLN